MKFTVTGNHTYRGGIRIPKPWIDYNTDHEKSIIKYYEDNIRIWDADTAGWSDHDFVFEDGKSYRLGYSWYLNESREVDETGEELPWVIDEYDIREISIEKADVPEKKIGRDWL